MPLQDSEFHLSRRSSPYSYDLDMPPEGNRVDFDLPTREPAKHLGLFAQLNAGIQKGLFETAPFGKRIFRAVEPQTSEELERFTPQTFPEKLGTGVGTLLGFSPSFVATSGVAGEPLAARTAASLTARGAGRFAKTVLPKAVSGAVSLVGAEALQPGTLAHRINQAARSVVPGVLFGMTGAIASKPLRAAVSSGLGAATAPPGQRVSTGVLFAGLPLLERPSPEPRPTLTPDQLKVATLIRQRHSEIATGQFDSEVYIRELERSLTKPERESIPFLIEKTDVPPELNRPDLTELVSTQKPRLEPVARQIESYLDDAHKFLLENYGDDVGFVEDYINHIWDVPRAKAPQVINWFTTQNPFLKQRSIRTIAQGVQEFGLRPKTLDVTELLRTYDQFKIKAVANLKFANALTNLTDGEGHPLVMRIDKAPPDWITIDHPALRRAIGIPITTTKRAIGEQTIAQEVPRGPQLPERSQEESLLLSKLPVKIHPEIADIAQVVLGRPFSAPAIRGFETLNAFSKKSIFAASLFHPFALSAAGVSSGIGDKMIGLWNPIRVYRALRNQDYTIFDPKNQPIARDATENGVIFGAIPDVQRGKVQAALATAEQRTRNIPGIAQTTQAIRSANELWDRALWDYYHNSLKFYAYEHLVDVHLRDPRNAHVPPELIKREIAQFVNDAFGSQAWDLLSVDPKFQQQLHWALLAPDWTISTLRLATSITGLGAQAAETAGVRARLGQSFFLKAALGLWAPLQLANFAISKASTGKGQFMWQNTPGHETHLFGGHNEDGTERYIRWAKQFMELPEFFLNPIGKFGGKLSPALNTLITQFTGVEPGSQFQQRFAKEPFFQSIPERAEAAGIRLFTPLSLRGVFDPRAITSVGLPISRGMTPGGAKMLFQRAIEQKDENAIKRVWLGALHNNLNADALFKQARNQSRLDALYEVRQDARQLYRELRGMKADAGRERLAQMRETGTLTPALERQLIKMAENERQVRRQQFRLGVSPPR